MCHRTYCTWWTILFQNNRVPFVIENIHNHHTNNIGTEGVVNGQKQACTPFSHSYRSGDVCSNLGPEATASTSRVGQEVRLVLERKV